MRLKKVKKARYMNIQDVCTVKDRANIISLCFKRHNVGTSCLGDGIFAFDGPPPAAHIQDG